MIVVMWASMLGATSPGLAEQDRLALVAKRDSPSASSRTSDRTAADVPGVALPHGCSEAGNCMKTNPYLHYQRGASRD